MFSSQRLSLFLGLSLLVLSVVSANKSNAQSLVVDSLDPQEESTSSLGGNNQVREVLSDLRATGRLFGNNNSFGTGNNFYWSVNTNRHSTPADSLEADSETIEQVPVTSAFNDGDSATFNANQLLERANQSLTNLPLLQLPIEVGILSNSSDTLEREPSLLLAHGSLPKMVSTPEPSASFLPWFGLAALGLVSSQCKLKK